MVLTKISKKDWGVGILLVLLLSIFFLPASQAFSKFLGNYSFPVLALVFALTNENFFSSLENLQESLLISAIPLMIGATFGVFLPSQGVSLGNWVWVCVLSPLGEELLFRGWFYQLLVRRFGCQVGTLTSPLPIALWGSSFAFSLWHFQNVKFFSLFFVLFQVVYTFWTGMWLSYLKYRTNSIATPIFFHSLLNTVSLAAMQIC